MAGIGQNKNNLKYKNMAKLEVLRDEKSQKGKRVAPGQKVPQTEEKGAQTPFYIPTPYLRYVKRVFKDKTGVITNQLFILQQLWADVDDIKKQKWMDVPLADEVEEVIVE
jgi:hypothetical protein